MSCLSSLTASSGAHQARQRLIHPLQRLSHQLIIAALGLFAGAFVGCSVSQRDRTPDVVATSLP